MSKTLVVLNEQHSLLEEQIEKLNEKFGFESWEIFSVPSKGWKLEKIKEIVNDLINDTIIFVSPIPSLMKLMSSNNWYVFHNDNRIKKELPNGKIIMTVSPTGWTIV